MGAPGLLQGLPRALPTPCLPWGRPPAPHGQLLTVPGWRRVAGRGWPGGTPARAGRTRLSEIFLNSGRSGPLYLAPTVNREVPMRSLYVPLVCLLVTLAACSSAPLTPEERALNREIREGIGGANCNTTGSVTQCNKW